MAMPTFLQLFVDAHLVPATISEYLGTDADEQEGQSRAPEPTELAQDKQIQHAVAAVRALPSTEV